MNARAAFILGLGFAGIVAVSLVAPAFPTAVSVIDNDGSELPELSEREEALLAEYAGEEPGGEPGGSLPAELFLVGVGIVTLAVLSRVAFSSSHAKTVAIGMAMVSVPILGLLVVYTWDGTGNITIPESFPIVAAAVFAGIILLRAAGSVSFRADRNEYKEPARDIGDPHPLNAGGQPQYRTQDALERNDRADDGVYRAWLALVETVDKHTETTTTAGEVRKVALDHGIDPNAVEELTNMFETRRYGGSIPSIQEERRALELMERIGSGAKDR